MSQKQLHDVSKQHLQTNQAYSGVYERRVVVFLNATLKKLDNLRNEHLQDEIAFSGNLNKVFGDSHQRVENIVFSVSLKNY